MLIRYFWIEKNRFGSRIEQEINLGGSIHFSYHEGELLCLPNQFYVPDLYRKYKKISDVSILVGENGSGKTEAMRSLNNIFTGDYKKCILIFQNDHRYDVYSSFPLKMKQDYTSGFHYLYHEVSPDELSNILGNSEISFVYLSSVYDRAHIMTSSSNWADLSTNKKVYEILADNENLELYRSNIIFQRLRFINILNDNEHTRSLFRFPKQIQVYFTPNQERLDRRYERLESADTLLKTELMKVHAAFQNEEDDNPSDSMKKHFLRQYIFYRIFQILIECSSQRVSDTEKVVKQMLKDMETNTNDYFLSYSISAAYRKLRSNEKEQFKQLRGKIITHIDRDSVISEELIGVLSDIADRINAVRSYSGSAYDYLYFENMDDELENEDINSAYNDIEHIVEKLIFKPLLKILDELPKNGIDNVMISEASESIEDDYDVFENLNDYDYYSMEDILDNLLDNVEIVKEELNKALIEREEESVEIQKLAVEEEPEYENFEVFMEQLNEMEQQLRGEVMLLEKNIRNFPISTENILYFDTSDDDNISFLMRYREQNNIFEARLDHEDLSSGQNSYFDMLFRLFLYVEERNKAIKHEQEIQGSVKKKENVRTTKIKKNAILLVDEGEVYLHPQFQKLFVDNFLHIISEIMPEEKVQLIFTTNSPLILTDIQDANVTYLSAKDKGKNRQVHEKTFGANISNLMVNNFFIQDGLVGQFAKEYITGIIKRLNEDDLSIDELDLLEKQIGIIGEPLIASKLNKMLLNKRYQKEMKQLDAPGLDQRIESLQKELDLMKKIRGMRINDQPENHT